MAELALDVRLDEALQPVGYLVRDENGGLSFGYSVVYANMPGAKPLSMSLPVRQKPYSEVLTRAFFGNLLQERDGALDVVMAREGIARDDIAGLLLHLGRDCPGAISVLPHGAPPVKVPGVYATDYEPFSDAQMATFVRSLYERQRLPDGAADPSPLAGVQSKVAVTLLPDGRFADPRPGSGAPTTHIIKVPERGHERDPGYEATAMALSSAIGVDTSKVEVRRFGGIDALVITRFDRDHDEQGRVVRVHQEDFAQALGLPRELKYERNGTANRRFDAVSIGRVLNETRQPALSRQTMIRSVLFDLMIGNTDAHAKNHALLYRDRRPVLAPRYDILPTRLDRSLTDELPFRIGEATTLEAIKAEDVAKFLDALGIMSRAAQRRTPKRLAEPIIQRLVGELAGLDQRHGRVWGDLIAHNVRRLAPVLGIEVPSDVDRDAFVLGRTGGWSMS